MLSAISCETVFSEEEMPQQFVPNGEVVMDDKYRSLVFNGNADSQEISFYVNDDWKILTTQSWVTFSENSGVAGNHTITVNVDKSYEDLSRQSSLTFVVERLRESFIITQERGNFMVPDQQSYGQFSLSDGEFDVEVRYNTEFTIDYDFGEDDEWIRTTNSITSVAAPSETETTTLTFEYDENKTYNDREATVLFVNESMDVEESFTVSQAGKIPVVLGDYETISLSYAAITEAVEVNLDAEIDFVVSTDVDWITPTRVSFDAGVYTFNYTALAYTDKSTTRTGHIYLKNSDENVERTITVIQDEYNDDAYITVSAAGGLSDAITTYLASSETAAADYNRLYISGKGVDLNSDDLSAITKNFTGIKLIDISATSTTEIPASQFKSKSTLQYFIFPTTIETIGSSAFQTSGLVEVNIPGDSEKVVIGSNAFSGSTSMLSVTLGEGVVTIGSQSFINNTSITDVYIPSTITSWAAGDDGSNKSFSGSSSLKNLTFAENLTAIGAQAFATSGLEEVYIPGSVSFSVSVNSNGNSWSFSSNINLKKITFGDGLVSIDNSPFVSCSLVESVYMPADVPTGTTLGSNVGSNVTGGVVLYVPEASYVNYSNSDWATTYTIKSVE